MVHISQGQAHVVSPCRRVAEPQEPSWITMGTRLICRPMPLESTIKRRPYLGRWGSYGSDAKVGRLRGVFGDPMAWEHGHVWAEICWNMLKYIWDDEMWQEITSLDSYREAVGKTSQLEQYPSLVSCSWQSLLRIGGMSVWWWACLFRNFRIAVFKELPTDLPH